VSLIPRRLRRACYRGRLGSSRGADGRRRWEGPTGATEAARSGRSTGAADARVVPVEDKLEINHVVLTGLIAAEPQRDRGRDGEPVTALLVSFPAPDESARWGSACCEVEVLDEIAERHRKGLRAGAAILIAGEMTGAGGIWAKLIALGEAS